MAIRIFQIGFNKCGTRTIHHFLGVNGIKGVHWDRGALAHTMFRNLAEGQSLIRGYEQFESFSDMESVGRETALEAYKLFPQLAQQFPDAVFILNTRNREDWIKSRFNHGNGRYAARWKNVLKITDDHKLANVWRADWDRHHTSVQDFFASGSHRFFQFDIAKDSPDLFARTIVERPIDTTKYQARGRTVGNPQPPRTLNSNFSL